jgi:hypothetical protein
MYEKPKLFPVGKVENVVRGFLPVGDDIDGTWMLPDPDYQGEVEDENEVEM